MIVETKPDWDDWARMKKLPAWQCLALSLELEPRSLGLDDFLVLRSVGSSLSMVSPDDSTVLKDMCKRLGLLLKAMADKDSGIAVESADLEQSLNVPAFVAWAQAKRWKLPAPLKALAAEPAAGSSAKKPTKKGAASKPKAKPRPKSKSKPAK